MVESKERVGLIGHGVMGAPMARRLHEAGYSVTAFDASDAAKEEILRRGYVLAATSSEVAIGATVTFVVVGFDDEVRELVGGPDGLLAGSQRGSLVVVSSTVSPTLMRELSSLFGSKGVAVLDAPLIRGAQAAIEGTLLITVGGATQDFERVKPLLACLASDVIHLGPVGAGQVGKALNNFLLWACQAADEEVFELCRAEGLDEEALQRALVLGSGNNGPLGSFLHSSATFRWAEKDMSIVLGIADDSSVSVPLAGVVRERVKAMKYRRGAAVPKSTAHKLEVVS